MSRVPTIARDSVVNDGSSGHFFNQGPQPQQESLVPDLETNPSFEYNQSHRHVPATVHNPLYQLLSSNSFMGADVGMHSAASSSSSIWSGFRSLVVASPYPSTSISSSHASPGQRPRESFQRPASSQYLPHAQTSLALHAMVSNGQGPSEPDPIKLSHEQTEAIEALLRQLGWYLVPDEEPPIRPDDPFITQGLILPTDKTRFSAFVLSTSTGGKTFCRIKHSIPTRNKLVECTFSAVHPKDAIAHVCDYLNYKPYKCKGKGGHPACDSTYPTNERRNDHYAKKKRGPDTHQICEKCGESVTARNIPRHRGRCTNNNKLELS